MPMQSIGTGKAKMNLKMVGKATATQTLVKFA